MLKSDKCHKCQVSNSNTYIDLWVMLNNFWFHLYDFAYTASSPADITVRHRAGSQQKIRVTAHFYNFRQINSQLLLDTMNMLSLVRKTTIHSSLKSAMRRPSHTVQSLRHSHFPSSEMATFWQWKIFETWKWRNLCQTSFSTSPRFDSKVGTHLQKPPRSPFLKYI